MTKPRSAKHALITLVICSLAGCATTPSEYGELASQASQGGRNAEAAELFGKAAVAARSAGDHWEATRYSLREADAFLKSPTTTLRAIGAFKSAMQAHDMGGLEEPGGHAAEIASKIGQATYSLLGREREQSTLLLKSLADFCRKKPYRVVTCADGLAAAAASSIDRKDMALAFSLERQAFMGDRSRFPERWMDLIQRADTLGLNDEAAELRRAAPIAAEVEAGWPWYGKSSDLARIAGEQAAEYRRKGIAWLADARTASQHYYLVQLQLVANRQREEERLAASMRQMESDRVRAAAARARSWEQLAALLAARADSTSAQERTRAQSAGVPTATPSEDRRFALGPANTEVSGKGQHDPAGVAHNCIRANLSDSYGGFTNTCSFAVSYIHCFVGVTKDVHDSSFFHCNRPGGLWAKSTTPGNLGPGKTNGTGIPPGATYYVVACREPYSIRDAQFEGTGLSGRCVR